MADTTTTTTATAPKPFLSGVSDFFGSILEKAPGVINAINQPKTSAAQYQAQYNAAAAQQRGTGFSWSSLSTGAKVGIAAVGALVVVVVLKVVFGKK